MAEAGEGTEDLAAAMAGRLPAGWRLEHHRSAGSTNDLARARAQAGDPGRLAVAADEQLAGRGRLGRRWVAPPGASLLVSMLLRPRLAAEESYALTMLAGAALCAAVERVAPVAARLKWPNDLLLAAPGGPRKAAGILTELGLAGGAVGWAVVGVGVNVSWSPEGDVDGRDLAATATSLAAAGARVRRADLLAALLGEVEARMGALADGRAGVFEEWRARLATVGEAVAVRLPGGELRGVAVAVEPGGALVVEDSAGRRHTVTAGDVAAG